MEDPTYRVAIKGIIKKIHLSMYVSWRLLFQSTQINCINRVESNMHIKYIWRFGVLDVLAD